jgi:hypothetical protein
VTDGREDEIPDELLDGLPEEGDEADGEIIETIVTDEGGVSYPYGKPGGPPPGSPPSASPPPAAPLPTAPLPAARSSPTAPSWGTTEALAGVRQSILSFLETAEQRLADADARLAQAQQNLARAEADRAQQLAALEDLMRKLGVPRGPP